MHVYSCACAQSGNKAASPAYDVCSHPHLIKLPNLSSTPNFIPFRCVFCFNSFTVVILISLLCASFALSVYTRRCEKHFRLKTATAAPTASASAGAPDQLKVDAAKVLEILGKTPKVTDLVVMIARKSFKTEYDGVSDQVAFARAAVV
jgi:hypothetical protein